MGQMLSGQLPNLPTVSTGRKFPLSWSHYLKLIRIDFNILVYGEDIVVMFKALPSVSVTEKVTEEVTEEVTEKLTETLVTESEIIEREGAYHKDRLCKKKDTGKWYKTLHFLIRPAKQLQSFLSYNLPKFIFNFGRLLLIAFYDILFF